MSNLAHLSSQQLDDFEAFHRQELKQAQKMQRFAEARTKGAYGDLVEIRREQLLRAKKAKASQ